MAWDLTVADLIRADLATRGLPCDEKKMFGGLAFMHRGNMVAGMYSGGAMFRVGKGNEPAATALPGVEPMQMAGRAMPGMVACPPATAADPATRAALLDIATQFAATLPDKVAKPKKAR